MPSIDENARGVTPDDEDNTSSDGNEQNSDLAQILEDLSQIMDTVRSHMASVSDTATGSEDGWWARLEALSNLVRSDIELGSSLQSRDGAARRRVARAEEQVRRSEEEIRRREEQLRFREEQIRSARYQAERSRRWCSSDMEQIRAEEVEEDTEELVVRIEIELSYEGEMEMRL